MTHSMSAETMALELETKGCAHTSDEDVACRAPFQFVGPSGYCWSHDPANLDARRLASQLGGARTAAQKRRRHGLTEDELPPLTNPAAAAAWTAIVGRAVATGRLNASIGQTVMRTVAEFLKAHEAS